MKICGNCLAEKTVECFSIDNSRPDGRNPYCLECVRHRAREWYAVNRERERAKRTAHSTATRQRLGTHIGPRKPPNIRVRDYRRRYPERARVESAHWRAASRKARPAWADPHRLAVVYAVAAQWSRDLGTPFHVDHIVPLRSRLVSGLHCEANLQIIPAVINVRKSNRVWPDMP